MNSDSLAALVEAGSDLAARKVARWHRAASAATVVPGDITLVPLPRYAPELNSAENIWEFLRKSKLAKTVFDCDDGIVDKACQAWLFCAAKKVSITAITTTTGEWETVIRSGRWYKIPPTFDDWDSGHDFKISCTCSLAYYKIGASDGARSEGSDIIPGLKHRQDAGCPTPHIKANRLVCPDRYFNGIVASQRQLLRRLRCRATRCLFGRRERSWRGSASQ